MTINDYLLFATPTVGLIGVLIGSFMQARLARGNKEREHLHDLQSQAYVDFLSSVSNVAVAQRVGDRSAVSSGLAALADAKSRICVYGSPEVVRQLAVFIRAGATLQTESEILAFTRLCLAMRFAAGMKRFDVLSTDISQVLFNLEVKDCPTPRKEMA